MSLSAQTAPAGAVITVDDTVRATLVDSLRLLKTKRRAMSERVQIDRLCDDIKTAEFIHFVTPQD